jgi:multidrug transporter EmrE-like cation transporter
LGRFALDSSSLSQAWFPYAIALGFLFITGFNVLAKSVQSFGVTLASISQKMALVISVGFAIIFFNEQVNTLKIAGIFTALAAIILINIPSKGLHIDPKIAKTGWYMLFLNFFFSGLIETILFYVETMNISESADIGFVVGLFGMAAFIGTIIMIGGWISGKMKFEWKNVIAGISLGIPNFFTIYLLLRVIDTGIEGSVIFPILNVSIILGSALLGLTLFKEKLSTLQWIGCGLGTLCIILIAIS